MDVTIDGIGVEIGRKAVLRDVSLDVRNGEFVSLLGASGAGKSTLLKVVAGILPQTEGTVSFDGRVVDELPAHKRRCPLVFQDIRLFPHLSVLDNVAFPAKMARMGRAERSRRAAELLARVGLSGFESRMPSELSGGQAQRVALARALASEPQALLLDEPFSGLDERLRDDMRSLVLNLQRAFGISTLMVTHDAGEALRMSDRICYLSEGRVVQTGAPQELYERPASREIALCHGACSQIEGRTSGGVFVADGLALAAPGLPDGPCCAVVRDAGARLVERDAGSLRVRCSVYGGEGYLARVDVGGQTLTVPTKRPVAAGARVDVEASARHCFFFPLERPERPSEADGRLRAGIV